MKKFYQRKLTHFSAHMDYLELQGKKFFLIGKCMIRSFGQNGELGFILECFTLNVFNVIN